MFSWWRLSFEGGGSAYGGLPLKVAIQLVAS